MRFTNWADIDTSFRAMDELRRRMSSLFQELDMDRWFPEIRMQAAWPPTSLYDAGNELILCALVPGLSEGDIDITATQDGITLTGERKPDVPQGYSVHRQEREHVRFSRSFTLPSRIDIDQTQAEVKNGVLTIHLIKAEEAKPRQISVKAS